MELKPDWAKGYSRQGRRHSFPLHLNQSDCSLPVYPCTRTCVPILYTLAACASLTYHRNAWPAPHRRLGVALFKKGDLAGAQKAYAGGIACDPNNAQCNDGMAEAGAYTHPLLSST